MTSDEIWEIWAPSDGPWSRWIKPVLFAWMRDHPALPGLPELAPEWEFSWLPASVAAGPVALILDLPGAEGVAASLALAKSGYRSVPLYNAIPEADDETPSAVPVMPIVQALQAAAPRLAELEL